MRQEPRATVHAKLFDYAAMCGSMARMEALVEYYGQFKQRRYLKEWMATLGDCWIICDTIGEHTAKLRRILATHRPHWHQLMDDDDLAAFNALPEVVTLYRGCGPKNRIGLSWSLNRDTANRFPLPMRYEQKHPRLLTARVAKAKIAAAKLGREEEEVIALVTEADIVSDEEAIYKPAQAEKVADLDAA